MDFLEKKIYFQLKESRLTEMGIIFIHGSGENSNSWINQMEGFNLNFQQIAVDLPSHGKSDIFEKLSMELYIEVIESLIEELGLKDAILCGHSLGGAVSLSCYFKNPNKYKALILCGTGARLRVNPMIFEMIKSGEYLKYVPVGVFYRKTPKHIIDSAIEDLSKGNPQVIYDDFSICNTFDVMNKINSIDIPCLIICGYADNLTPIKYSQYFKDNIKNSTLHIIKNAAHMVIMEQPDEVNAYIQEFVEAL